VTQRKWSPILARAREIVESYTATGVTLRQLFYRLVSFEILRNTKSDYTNLSKLTAEARRDGTFPTLIDNTRSIHRYATWDGPEDARRALRQQYRRDRTEGQERTVYVGVEKAGMIAQLELWFSDFGLPVLALGGYSSQTYVDEVRADIDTQRRPAVLLYAGDFDPSGEDIVRDFVGRVGCFDDVHRVALMPEQVAAYSLPPLPGKASDSRAAGFVAKHGRLVQEELDALPPDVLHRLYSDALAPFLDLSKVEASKAREAEDKQRL
jgi:hypothetical protein